ncbi:MAG: putative serine protease HtrA [Verrucomicrobia subdivision 3 bacterium]|nr:putative serine protease HtrA [Limisphaerales bacterium]MCS1416763.1 putative serine protease HtrA [Limisphaerales bacterium]
MIGNHYDSSVFLSQNLACFLERKMAIISGMRCSIRLVLGCILLCGFPAVIHYDVEGVTLQLGGGASISGEVVAERKDQVVVDVGYTLLLVPRAAIVAIDDNESGEGMVDSKTGGGLHELDQTDIFCEATGHGRTGTIAELAGQLGESVVQIRTPSGLGSGFFISPQGYLITNFHVIESETEIFVDVYHQISSQLERKSYREVRIVALNRFADLALLKIEDEGATEFQYVVLGDMAGLSVGERVFAIGSPLGLERTVTEGILSAKTREFQGWLYLQTTAQINPGNSGGPMFNRRGEVVGVINMKSMLGEGLGFAIPVDYLKHFLRYREAFAYDSDNPNNPYRYLPPPTAFSEAGDPVE